MLERVEDPGREAPGLALVPPPEAQYAQMSRMKFLANTAMIGAFGAAAAWSISAENASTTDNWIEPFKSFGNSGGHLVLGAGAILGVAAYEFAHKKELTSRAFAKLAAASVFVWDTAGETARTAMTGFKYNPLKPSEIPETSRDLFGAVVGAAAAVVLNFWSRKSKT